MDVLTVHWEDFKDIIKSVLYKIESYLKITGTNNIFRELKENWTVNKIKSSLNSQSFITVGDIE